MNAQTASVASTLARLRNLADAGGLSFNDVLQRYVIELQGTKYLVIP